MVGRAPTQGQGATGDTTATPALSWIFGGRGPAPDPVTHVHHAVILLLTLPWLAVLAFMLFRVRTPRELGDRSPVSTPFVSVVVPARNEAVNIGPCLGSLTASRYPSFEVVVVDDASEDGTGDLARAAPRGTAEAVTVVEGRALPDGWLGKPWACAQGAAVARGDVLLFTDADTIHAPDLMARAVAALQEDGADVVTVAGVQLMESFWERLVQPQVFMNMVLRFFDIERSVAKGRWRDAIANGQFLMFRREAYEAIGRHEAVRGEVVEDLALAQLVVRKGLRMSVRMAETALATRMYRSLSHIVEGWSKNLVVGARLTVAPWLRPWVAPASAVSGLVLWIAPPLVLLSALGGLGGPRVLTWSVSVVAISTAFWMAFTRRMGASMWYGLLYPLGAAVALYILVRSWMRGHRVEWKGRSYVIEERAPGA